MKMKILIVSLFAAGFLSGCGKNFQTTAPLSSAPVSVTPAPQVSGQTVVSNKILQDIANGLLQQSNGVLPSGLTPSQIQSLILSASSALHAGGLANNQNVHSLLPTLIQGLTQGLGNLQLGGTNSQNAALLAMIGKLVLGSALHLNGVGLTAELVQLVTQSLFQNLPAAGVSNGDLSQVAGAIMNGLIGHLGQQAGLQGLPNTLLSSLLQSLTSGATLGIGQLNLANLGTTLISDILHQMGVGSANGISGLVDSNGSSQLVQSLITAIVNGAQSGLVQGIGNQPNLGLDIKQLLGNLISGQHAGVSASPMPAAQQQVAAAFLQFLLSRI